VQLGESIGATWRSGRIELDEPQDWPDGLRLQVVPVRTSAGFQSPNGHVIIVGFGLAGRCVADLLDRAGVSYTIVEKNPITIETQRALGKRVVPGDASDRTTLMEAGLHTASILALTIPDEEAVLNATSLARRLRPDIYIIARTNYASQGMRASQLGADAVVKAEQAVAVQFYDRLCARLGLSPEAAKPNEKGPESAGPRHTDRERSASPGR
jgi:CPA2 family monovalent cation:H+ antiporter-2